MVTILTQSGRHWACTEVRSSHNQLWLPRTSIPPKLRDGWPAPNQVQKFIVIVNRYRRPPKTIPHCTYIHTYIHLIVIHGVNPLHYHKKILFSLLSWSHDITYVITESRSLKRKSNIGCNNETTQDYHGADDDDLLTQDINTTGLDHWLFTPLMFLENNIPTSLYPKFSRLGLQNRVCIDSACSYLPTKCYNW